MISLKKKLKKGLTLIEAAMVLAIATLVVAGIMIFFQSASVNSKTNEAMAQLSSLQGSVRSVYAGQSTYAGLAGTDLINARVVPNKMVAGTELRHAFNARIDIQAEDIGGTANAFSIAYNNVPFEACVKMGQFDLGTGLAEFEIGGTAVSLPASVGDVNSACDGGGNNGGNQTMKWTFY